MEGNVKHYNRKPNIYFIETKERDYIALKEELVEKLKDGDRVTFTESKVYRNVFLESEDGTHYISRELISIASNVRKLSKALILKH